jgi:peroxiredoxin Q/BCP
VGSALFLPEGFHRGCTTQACELRDNIFAFKKADAVILGVSVDDVASHEKFAKEHSLPFDILADRTRRCPRSTAC